MTYKSDIEKAVLFGAVVATFFLSMFYVFKKENKSQKPQSNFEVVDSYKGCEIVRWLDLGAQFKYFLYCPK
jgi:hypothetical protein